MLVLPYIRQVLFLAFFQEALLRAVREGSVVANPSPGCGFPTDFDWLSWVQESCQAFSLYTSDFQKKARGEHLFFFPTYYTTLSCESRTAVMCFTEIFASTYIFLNCLIGSAEDRE
ncbi:hypothetical protein F5Y05DRAFT_105821 [Hypoxylon sp. FL0543]|nr:hypothetical protein F5Y05DRAFT_105821 [Hypoxylon sp. FL0543]